MSKQPTLYLIIPDGDAPYFLAQKLDAGYSLERSWVAGNNVHHILFPPADDPVEQTKRPSERTAAKPLASPRGQKGMET